jgi:hypothetical protein
VTTLALGRHFFVGLPPRVRAGELSVVVLTLVVGDLAVGGEQPVNRRLCRLWLTGGPH